MDLILPIAFLPGINGEEIVVIFLVVLLLFGPRRLPEIARSIGRTLDQLRRASQDFKDQLMQVDREISSDQPKTNPDALPKPQAPAESVGGGAGEEKPKNEPQSGEDKHDLAG